ncbi:MAG: hypothetical protein Ct9H300mP1_28250 [Planctomycetaceae bacterium]|nr:MAG: hypothetical protein Ct9H300mP1_28250 [Planctomycetaceae bacterium]
MTATVRLRQRYSQPTGVVLDLLAGDAIDREVAGFRMVEIESADRGGGHHRVAFRQADPRPRLGLHQLEQSSLQHVIGAGRVTERRTDATVFLGNQILAIQALRITPLAADPRVQKLGKCLGQAIGQRPGHDRTVVVVFTVEPFHQRVDPFSGRDGKYADMITPTASHRCHVIDQRPKLLLPLPLPLLPEHRKTHPFVSVALVTEQHDILAIGDRGPEPVNGTSGQQLAADDLLEQRPGVIEQLTGLGSQHGVIEDPRVLTSQFPGLEKR